MPRLATLWVPDFLRFDDWELNQLLHCLHDPLATHVYFLIRVHADFKSGHYLGGYARLIELCTPPQPERGQRRPGPSMRQVRRVIDDLIAVKLLERGDQNQSQGQLRLWHHLPIPKDALERKEGRISGRVSDRANPIPKRPTAVQAR